MHDVRDICLIQMDFQYLILASATSLGNEMQHIYENHTYMLSHVICIHVYICVE